MITILSPAKIFRELQEGEGKVYNPLQFHNESLELIEALKQYNEEELAELMKMSMELAKINKERYNNFHNLQEKNAYEALLYFHGEAYKGIESESLTEKARAYIHDHVRILSGLYGMVKPLECIKPYRLEMGTKFSNSVGKDLYAYWKEKLTQVMLETLKETTGEQVLLNLASDEYSKVIDFKKIEAHYPVVKISFKEQKGEVYKVVGMYAKKARGMMVRYIGEYEVDSIEGIKAFNQEGYSLNIELSTSKHLVFTRKSEK